MNPQVFRLFKESNFEAYDRQRYPAVLEEGLVQNGLGLDDVLAVAQDSGLWAICQQGIFHADLRGIFAKRIEVDDFIPYSEMMEMRVKPSGPHTRKLVIEGSDSKKLVDINFSAAGPERTIEGAAAHCQRIAGIVKSAWEKPKGDLFRTSAYSLLRIGKFDLRHSWGGRGNFINRLEERRWTSSRF
jgi:hypothetical protein